MSATSRPGRLFPVCCAAVISAEVKDNFLMANLEDDDSVGTMFVFVDDVSATYMEESELEENTTSPPSPPFQGKTPYQCGQVLQQMRQDTGSDLNYNSFVIMDARSLEDQTVLLVEEPGEQDGGYARSVRTTFGIVQRRFFIYMSGKVSVEEDRERALGTEEGVLRTHF